MVLMDVPVALATAAFVAPLEDWARFRKVSQAIQAASVSPLEGRMCS